MVCKTLRRNLFTVCHLPEDYTAKIKHQDWCDIFLHS